MDAESLVVLSAVATDGPALKRIMPRARGSAAPIKKRMCHITIIVGAKPEEPEAKGKKKNLSDKAKTAAPAKAAKKSKAVKE